MAPGYPAVPASVTGTHSTFFSSSWPFAGGSAAGTFSFWYAMSLVSGCLGVGLLSVFLVNFGLLSVGLFDVGLLLVRFLCRSVVGGRVVVSLAVVWRRRRVVWRRAGVGQRGQRRCGRGCLRAGREAVVGKVVGVGGVVVGGNVVVVGLGNPPTAPARRFLCASAGGVLPVQRGWWRQRPWPSMRLVVSCSAGCGPAVPARARRA